MAQTQNNTADFDRNAVREAFMAGKSPAEIAKSDTANRQAIANYISANKQHWIDEARFSRIVSDDRKTVIRVRTVAPNGGVLTVPISLPRNSMHLKSMQERGA